MNAPTVSLIPAAATVGWLARQLVDAGASPLVVQRLLGCQSARACLSSTMLLSDPSLLRYRPAIEEWLAKRAATQAAPTATKAQLSATQPPTEKGVAEYVLRLIDAGEIPEAFAARHMCRSIRQLREELARSEEPARQELIDKATMLKSEWARIAAQPAPTKLPPQPAAQARQAKPKPTTPPASECITVLVSGQRCGKAFALDGSKTSNAKVSTAIARVCHAPDAAALADVLRTIVLPQHNAAVILNAVKGVAVDEDFNIVSANHLAGLRGVAADDRAALIGVHTINGKKYVARLKENFSPCQWVLLDRDTDAFTPTAYGAKQLPYDAWLSLVDRELLPGAATCERVWVPSASARVLLPNGSPAGAGNGHTYLRGTGDLARVDPIRAQMMAKARAAGIAWKKPNRHGVVPRDENATIIDPSVMTAGRLVFDGLPHVDAGLTIAPTNVQVHVGPPLDLSAFIDLTDDQIAAHNATSAAQLHRSSDGSMVARDFDSLKLDTVLELASGKTLTVQEWINSGEKYTRVQAPFRDSPSVSAFIKKDSSGQPFVHDVGTSTTYHLPPPDPADVFHAMSPPGAAAPPSPAPTTAADARKIIADNTATAQANASGADFLDKIDLAQHGQHRDFDAEPPSLEIVVDHLLVRGSLTVLSGDGGSLKSMLALTLAYEIASGVPFLADTPFTVPVTGPCLYLTAEDNADDVQRRRKRLIERARNMTATANAKGLPADYKQKLRDGLQHAHVVPTNSVIVTLYQTGGATPALDALERLCARVSALRLLIVDPAGSYFRGDMNDAAEFGGFVMALRALAARLNIAVLLIHHIAKNASRDIAEGSDLMAHAALGSVMVTNGARVAAVMARMAKANAPQWGVPEDAARAYVGIAVPKANSLPPLFEPVWFCADTGVLVPARLNHIDKGQFKAKLNEAKQSQGDEDMRRVLLHYLINDYKEKRPPSRTTLTDIVQHRAHKGATPTRAFVNSELARGSIVLDPSVKGSGSSQGCIRPGNLDLLRPTLQPADAIAATVAQMFH